MSLEQTSLLKWYGLSLKRHLNI